MKEDKYLIFVYNANSDVFSTVTDYVHKVLSPQTYPCSLCALTHSNFGMKQEWKTFLTHLSLPKEFLHKDEFIKQYPSEQGAVFPAVYLKSKASLQTVVPAAELNACRSIQELKELLLAKVYRL